MNVARRSGCHRAARGSLVVAIGLIGSGSACATLQQLAALRSVDFAVDRASDVRVAGIDVMQLRSFGDLRAVDAGVVVASVAQGALPLDMRVHLRGENPAANGVPARLMRMDWTLFLEDRETISGVINGPIVLPPGEPQDIPVDVHLDLVDFFEGNARDLFDLSLRLAGLGGAPKDISFEAMPTVETSLGPVRYPSPIRIRARVGE